MEFPARELAVVHVRAEAVFVRPHGDGVGGESSAARSAKGCTGLDLGDERCPVSRNGVAIEAGTEVCVEADLVHESLAVEHHARAHALSLDGRVDQRVRQPGAFGIEGADGGGPEVNAGGAPGRFDDEAETLERHRPRPRRREVESHPALVQTGERIEGDHYLAHDQRARRISGRVFCDRAVRRDASVWAGRVRCHVGARCVRRYVDEDVLDGSGVNRHAVRYFERINGDVLCDRCGVCSRGDVLNVDRRRAGVRRDHGPSVGVVGVDGGRAVRLGGAVGFGRRCGTGNRGAAGGGGEKEAKAKTDGVDHGVPLDVMVWLQGTARAYLSSLRQRSLTVRIARVLVLDEILAMLANFFGYNYMKTMPT